MSIASAFASDIRVLSVGLALTAFSILDNEPLDIFESVATLWNENPMSLLRTLSLWAICDDFSLNVMKVLLHVLNKVARIICNYFNKSQPWGGVISSGCNLRCSKHSWQVDSFTVAMVGLLNFRHCPVKLPLPGAVSVAGLVSLPRLKCLQSLQSASMVWQSMAS